MSDLFAAPLTKRRSQRWLAIFVVLAIVGLPTQAQKKEFTKQQLLRTGFPDGVIEKLPVISGWQDDLNYIISKPESGGTFVVNVKTGKETPYTPPAPKRPASVYVQRNDLYLKTADGTEKRLTQTPDDREVNPQLSPDENYVAYTRNNDLYVFDIINNKENRITHDGSDVILNGYSSWVYMEEILGRFTRHKAFWWSPDSKSLVFFRSDDSNVPLFTITDADGQNGYVEKMHYPKAGDPNPEVKIGIVSPDGGAITWADFNAKDDQYFGTPVWRPDGSAVWIQWMNRDQNQLKVYEVNIKDGSKKELYTEEQKTWISLDETNRFTFLSNNKGFILQSDKTGWNQLYLHDMNGKLINRITDGNFTVTDIVKIDEKKQVIYFTARKENTARVDLYSIKMNGKDMKRLTTGDYTHTVNLSPQGNYFISTFSNASTPTKVALYDNKGNMIRLIADAKGSNMDEYNIAKTELIRVKSDDGLYDLPAVVTWPLNMDKNKKYPVLISIYGGPGAGTVMDRFNLNPTQQWFAQEGLIQIAMDHRASGHFGKEGINYMYRNLGYWEIKDYSTIVRHLINNGADPERICITGFSYGGYLSAYALTYGADVFTHGMAGGSVIDWTLYDTHYTERFMDTPKDNPEGYKSSSVLTHAHKYKGVLQLVHGAIDENVHLQNTMQLVSKLQDLNKDFELMIYPGNRHGIGGVKGNHYQNLKTKFIYKYLLKKEVPRELIR